MKIEITNVPIRVLVVDDSTFIRNAISNMLAKSSDIQIVGTARNGEEAIQKVMELKPDVMTLDIDMPLMNGLQVLEHLMHRQPLPVIIISSLTDAGAKETLRALELGAVDFIPKHLNGSVLSISNIENQLLQKVKASARAMGKIGTPALNNPIPHKKETILSGSFKKGREEQSLSRRVKVDRGPSSSKNYGRPPTPRSLVIIGCSTGGPKVLQEILPQIPTSIRAAILIIQHMPQFFTKPFAERLDQLCHLHVSEAADGDALEEGGVVVAPGGQHLRVEQGPAGQVRVRISDEPSYLPYRPSVDVAMESAAPIYGVHLLGVVLTGMGNDGMMGAHAIKATGGRTLVQDEATSIVYGMPKAVVDAGYADTVVSISQVAHALTTMIGEIDGQIREDARVGHQEFVQ